MNKLQVYVTRNCWTCAEARRIVAEMMDVYGGAVRIELIEMTPDNRPEQVFAAPTYLLNEKVIYLGNPTRAELNARLQRLLSSPPSTILASD